MISWIFAAVISFVVVLLCGHEISRYRDSQVVRSDLPYPRRRLTRRLGIAALLIFILLLVQLKPEGRTPYFDLFWYVVCLVAALVLIVLILRDIHDASVQVVAEHQ